MERKIKMLSKGIIIFFILRITVNDLNLIKYLLRYTYLRKKKQDMITAFFLNKMYIKNALEIAFETH